MPTVSRSSRCFGRGGNGLACAGCCISRGAIRIEAEGVGPGRDCQHRLWYRRRHRRRRNVTGNERKGFGFRRRCGGTLAVVVACLLTVLPVLAVSIKPARRRPLLEGGILSRWQWRHAIEVPPAEEGVHGVRFPLTVEVLGRARPDLGDLRVVSASGYALTCAIELPAGNAEGLRRAAGHAARGEAVVGGRQAARAEAMAGSTWVIEVAGGAAFCDRLIVTAADREFLRPYRLELVEEDGGRVLLARGEWRHTGQDAASLEIRFDEARVRRFHLTVTDADQAPLRLLAAEWSGAAREVVVASGAKGDTEPAWLYVGNPAAGPVRVLPDPAAGRSVGGAVGTAAGEPGLRARPQALGGALAWVGGSGAGCIGDDASGNRRVAGAGADRRERRGSGGRDFCPWAAGAAAPTIRDARRARGESVARENAGRGDVFGQVSVVMTGASDRRAEEWTNPAVGRGPVVRVAGWLHCLSATAKRHGA